MTEQRADYGTPGTSRADIYTTDEFTLHGCRLVIDVDDRGAGSLRVYAPCQFGERLIEAYGSQPPEVLLRRLEDMFARAQPVVITGAQGCGKYRHAAGIARFFNAKTVEPEWDGKRPLPAGCVAFTNAEIESLPPGAVVYSFERVMDRVGLAIDEGAV